jgi:hypothetical protein
MIETEEKMAGTWRTFEREIRNAYIILIAKRGVKRPHLGYVGIEGRIILRGIFKA